MKKLILGCAVLLALSGCTSNGGSTEAKIDSLEQKIDTALDKAADSIGVKAKNLKERIQRQWNNRKDSVAITDTVVRDSIK